MRRWVVSFALILVVMPRVSRADFDDDERARVLFQKAEVQFNLQQFDRALALYTQAYELRPLPGFLFNIGQCQRYLGQDEQALFSYKIYLVRVPDAPNRLQVEELIQQMEQRLRRTPASVPATSQAAPATPPRTPLAPELGDGQDPQGPRALWIWTGIAVFAGLTATGVVTGQMAHNRAEEYNDPKTSIPRREDLRDSGQRLRTGSIVSFALGGATAVATGLYYYLGYRARRRTRLMAMPTLGGGALSIGGEF